MVAAERTRRFGSSGSGATTGHVCRTRLRCYPCMSLAADAFKTSGNSRSCCACLRRTSCNRWVLGHRCPQPHAPLQIGYGRSSCSILAHILTGCPGGRPSAEVASIVPSASGAACACRWHCACTHGAAGVRAASRSGPCTCAGRGAGAQRGHAAVEQGPHRAARPPSVTSSTACR